MPDGNMMRRGSNSASKQELDDENFLSPMVFPNQEKLREDYGKNLPTRTQIVRELEFCIEETVSSLPSHPRVQGRVKSFESYFKKYIRLLKRDASACTRQMTDIIGIRIICPFLEDLAAVEELIREKFKIIEVERKGGDHTFREFGYESIHLLINIPDYILKKHNFKLDESVEIQIRTILQDAWAEVEHELVYKVEFTPFDDPLKRKLAAVNASLSLADIIFQEVRSYQRELNGELGKRRNSFFKKIEESTDAVLFFEEKETADLAQSVVSPLSANVSIDELLLNALYAHNKNKLSEAIAIYTQILEMEPNTTISALIYKHRGMAYFASSHYGEAIEDFSESLKLDPTAYKAAYYKGVIYSVLQQYADAVDAYNDALEINRYQPYCLYRRGQAYYHLEDFPQALADCDSALALEPFEAARKFKDLLLNKLKM